MGVFDYFQRMSQMGVGQPGWPQGWPQQPGFAPAQFPLPGAPGASGMASGMVSNAPAPIAPGLPGFTAPAPQMAPGMAPADPNAASAPPALFTPQVRRQPQPGDAARAAGSGEDDDASRGGGLFSGLKNLFSGGERNDAPTAGDAGAAADDGEGRSFFERLRANSSEGGGFGDWNATDMATLGAALMGAGQASWDVSQPNGWSRAADAIMGVGANVAERTERREDRALRAEDAEYIRGQRGRETAERERLSGVFEESRAELEERLGDDDPANDAAAQAKLGRLTLFGPERVLEWQAYEDQLAQQEVANELARQGLEVDRMRAFISGPNRPLTNSERRIYGHEYDQQQRRNTEELGILEPALPYALEVLRVGGDVTRLPEGYNPRMRDVALLRAAARSQTGPGVLTQSEVWDTLSPSLQQSLLKGAAYADIGRTGMSAADRQVLADYVVQTAAPVMRNAHDIYESYQVRLPEGETMEGMGMRATRFVHPDDLPALTRSVRAREGGYEVGRSYVAPSGRRYKLEGPGDWRFTGWETYDPSRQRHPQGAPAQSGGADQAAPARPAGVPAEAVWNAARQQWELPD